jgi:hypothetical protein
VRVCPVPLTVCPVPLTVRGRFYESSDDGTSQFRLRITRRAVNKLKLLGRDLTDDDVEEHNLRRILGSKFAKKDSNKGLVQKNNRDPRERRP